jgi:peptide/nickel transport system substrate-binding protein
VLALLLAGGVVGVRAANGPGEPGGAPEPPKGGGTLRLLSEDRFASLDPAALGSPRQRDVGRLLYRTLMTYGSDGHSVRPDLATGPGVPSAGGRVWTYALRSARYENGNDVVADDVVRGIRRSLARGALPGGWLAGVAAPDRATLVLRFARPFADADWFVALIGAAPVPPTGISASGPYRLASLVVGSSFRLVRNESWDGERPGPDEVDAQLGLSGPAIDRRILAGTGEDAFAVTDKPVLDVVPATDHRQVSGADGSLLFTAMNLRRGPFVDLKVRQALEVAFPVARLRSPATAVATDLLPPSVPGHHDLDLYGQKARDHAGDPARARKLLREAGYDAPVAVTAAVPASAAAMGEVLRSALAPAGFQVTVTVVPDARYYETVGVPARQPDLVSYAWSPDWLTPSAVIPQLFTCAALTTTGNHNVANHCDRGFDQQVALALAELDPKAREAMWRALDERLVAEAVVVPRSFGVSTSLVGARVRGAKSAVCFGGAVDLLRLTLHQG